MRGRRDAPLPGDGVAGRRTASRQSVEALLLLAGSLFELRAGAADTARSRVTAIVDAWPGGGLDPDVVVNAMIASGLRGDTGYWREHCVPTGQRLVAELCGGPVDRPPDLGALPPRRFQVAFQRTFDLTRTPARRLRMPAPVADPHLMDLEIKADAVGCDISVAPGRLEAKPASGAGGRVRLSARFGFTATAGLSHGLGPDGAEERELWLAAREGPIQVTADVAALAARLAAPWATPFDQVLAFRDHLIDTMACGRIALDSLAGAAPTDWVLANGWFDCRLGAALLAALCRAQGLPARLVGGYLLWQAPSEHFWMEVWLPDRGWTPFDLLAWDLSAGGRDQAWRNIYAGAIDYRMKTQVFPRIFTGAPGVPMGPAWHRLSRLTTDGTETQIVSIPEGGLIYADRVSVIRD